MHVGSQFQPDVFDVLLEEINSIKPVITGLTSIESTDSGPIPSPFITTAVFPNMS